jgi:hypothetical protein
LAVTGYQPSTRIESGYVDSKKGDPLVRIRVHGTMPAAAASGQTGQPLDEPVELALDANGLFVDSSFGPAGTTFWRVSEPTEVDDFLNPMVTDFVNPPKDLPESGVLHAHYAGRMEKIPIEGNVGKRIPLPNSSMEVEISDYRAALHPHQHAPGEEHDEAKEGPEPADPVVRLVVHSEGRTLDQFVMARAPYWPSDRDQLLALLSRGGNSRMWPPSSPVRFWFHHPAVRPATTGKLEIIAAPSGELYYRVWARAGLVGKGKINPDTDYPCWMGMKFRLQEFRPSVELERRVVAAPRPQGGMGEPVPGIQVAMQLASKGGTDDHEFWLQKTAGQRLVTPDGQVLEVSFDIRRHPLDFTLKLKDFEVGFDPGTTKAATYTSVVDLRDLHREVDSERVITMNEPLVHGPSYHFARAVENATGRAYQHWLWGIPIRGFVRSVRGFTDLTFYQSSYYKNSDGSMTSVFAVALDPGYPIKMLGCTMIVGGIATMFYMRAYFFKPRAARTALKSSGSRTAPPQDGSSRGSAKSQPVAVSAEK